MTLFSTLFVFWYILICTKKIAIARAKHILNKSICDINLYMPRKRRKAIASTETTPDIPYPKVRVEWIDCVSDLEFGLLKKNLIE